MNMKKKQALLALFLLLIVTTFAYPENEWRAGSTAETIPGTTLIRDIDAVSYQDVVAPLDRLTARYRRGMSLAYSSASTLIVTAGEVSCGNSGDTVHKFRRNTSSTNVTFSDIDTGAEASSTTYYVYAACDADALTATFKVSTNATSPSGITYYSKLGSFYNDSSSNIDQTKVYNNAYEPSWTDSDGARQIGGVYEYGSSSSTSTFRDSKIKVAYGTISVGGGSTTTITGLPFSSASTFSATCSLNDTTAVSEDVACQKSGGSSVAVHNNQGSTREINWIAIGF